MDNIIHETWECDGLKYEAWRKEHISIDEQKKTELSKRMHDHYLATEATSKATNSRIV